MIFKDISNFNNTSDYLPIITAALIIDLLVILRLILGQVKSVSLTDWYHKYGISGVLADVLSISLGVVLVRHFYHFIFTKYSLLSFLFLTVIVQITHDLLFAQFFMSVPRGRSAILDTFKDYAKESGPSVLLNDALMMIFTVLLSSILAGLSLNANILIFLFSLYLVPYFLYSIPKN